METPENPAEPAVPEDPEDPEDYGDELCLSCVRPNPSGTHFCAHCGAPLTSYAATAPLESTFAEGAFYRKALQSDRWSRPMRYLILAFLALNLAGIILYYLLPLFHTLMPRE